jgi:DNA-binding NarL/FixJ family response regulator
VEGFTQHRAVVVHEYPLWRDALTDVLEDLGFDVLLTTSEPDEAVARIREVQPDLLVVGISSELDGIECVRKARRVAGALRAAVIAPKHDDEEADEALAAGAYVYIAETSHPDDLRAAIRQGFQTSVFLGSGDPSDAARLVRPAPAKAEAHGLTKREQEILRLVSEGKSNGQVAQKLWVTEQTVKFHLSNIYRKLGVTNRTEAGRQAQLIGLLDDDSTRESVNG